jgi:GR25 family glycosyltransferase involved in LPS biosynthesis
MLPQIYIINFNDEIRRQKMIDRLTKQNLKFKFTPPVYDTDERITKLDSSVFGHGKLHMRSVCIMLQHLDSIRDFVENTDASHCIVFEDDVLVHKNFANCLPKIVLDFDQLNLDVLLLGYLLPYKLNELDSETISYRYENYPDDLWGAHTYLLSRNYAKILLEKFTLDYAINNFDKPYTTDWIITKYGRRALLYPMITLEEGEVTTGHQGQIDFHRLCSDINRNKDFD